jgi:hypothetical protein
MLNDNAGADVARATFRTLRKPPITTFAVCSGIAAEPISGNLPTAAPDRYLEGIVTGRIEPLVPDKRAGVIAAEDGQNYFFHEGPLRDPRARSCAPAISFDVIRGPLRSRVDVIGLVRHAAG